MTRETLHNAKESLKENMPAIKANVKHATAVTANTVSNLAEGLAFSCKSATAKLEPEIILNEQLQM